MIITFITFSFFQKLAFKTLPILSIVLCFVVGNYVIYVEVPRQTVMPSIQEVASAEYLMVPANYPKFYFIFNKKAPDRYFQSFFLLDFFNKKSIEEDVKRHKSLDKDKLKNTLFMMVEFSEHDRQMNADYLRKFGRVFMLTKQKKYQYESGKIELYSSRL